jgi:ubiquinone/menaquinone biosynthesis C-methylase UbiE
MVDFHNIYENQSKKYDLLIKREDYKQNLLSAIIHIKDPTNKDIIDMGAGTGRIGVSLTPYANSISLFDISLNMLKIAEKNMIQTRFYNYYIRQADNRNIPMPDQSADIVISGWSISSLVIDFQENWEKEIEKVIGEMKRLIRKNGTIIIIETLGTACENPCPPDELKDFYKYLEEVHHFKNKWIRTDFKFNDMDEARELISFFFGKTTSEKIVSNGDNIVPECTGIWWL